MPERVRFRDLYEARETLSPAEIRFERRRRGVALFAGPFAFAVLLLASPPGLTPAAARLLAVIAWVLVWWIGEAVPIPVTAVLGPALLVPLGVASAKEAFASFGDPIILLFLGSFVIAEAMSSTGLDRRAAYGILSLRWVGSSASRILIAFAVTIAVLSMWLSNTATAAMMYPIGMGILAAVARLSARGTGGGDAGVPPRYGTALMLATAYAASIGGIGTPVGSPPNLIVLGQLDALAGTRVTFFRWMAIAAPVMVLMLVALVVYLRRALPPEVDRIPGGAEVVRAERDSLGDWSRAEKNVLAAFAITVALWVVPGLVAAFAGETSPLAETLADHLPEGAVAVIGAALLFVLPVDWKARRFTLTWNEAVRIDWGTLLLFGGGLSLGAAMFKTGLAEAAGNALIGLTGARSLVALTFLFALIAIVLTETISNTAAATMVAPLAIAAAQAAGVSPVPPAMAAGLGASMAFMLPVSTPPNAIVYGSGCVSIGAMLRHGVVLDLVSAVIVPTGVLVLWHLTGG